MNRILIVDDMAVNLMMTRELFHMTNCDDVDTCEDGESALSLVKKQPYDLILLDRRMPGMDGVEVLRRLREYWEETGAVRTYVVALSGDDSEGAREDFLALGFDEYLAKPLLPEKLFAVCASFLKDFCVLPRFGGEAFFSGGSGKDGNALPQEDAEGFTASLQSVTGEIPSWLKEAELIDVSEGICHSGSLQRLLEGLTIFSDSLSRRMEEIEAFFREADWDNYLIRVHGMKGICGLLGLTSLKEQAAALEKACMAKDTAFLQAHTKELLISCHKMEEVLSPLRKDDELEKEPISPEQLRDAYLTLGECLDFYDYHSMDMVLSTLREYALPAEDEARVKKLREALNKIDRDALLSLVKSVM